MLFQKSISFRFSILPWILFVLSYLNISATAAQENPVQTAKQIRTSLQKQIKLVQPSILQRLQYAESWLQHSSQLRAGLQQNQNDGLVDLILLWNNLDRSSGPSTLLTQNALDLRSNLARSAMSISDLKQNLDALVHLEKELLEEMEAWARIERYRKRDCVITVLHQDGTPVPDSHVTINQTNHAFLFGCNIFRWENENTERQRLYRQRFADLMNYATLGFYWASYERQKGAPREEHWKQVARWCLQHGIQTKGHPLAWNTSDPAWLPDDPDQIYRLQLERIEREVSRFKGFVDWWDVVNEVTHFDRDSFWERSPKMTAMWAKYGQFDFAKQCFITARKAHPNAFLLINDYEMRTRNQTRRDNPKRISKGVIYEDVIDRLTDDNGKPLYDGIGIQSHMHGGPWSTGRILQIVKRFARYHVPLHFTETTIVSGPGKWKNWKETTPEGERFQADEVERFYRTVFSCPEVDALTWWDFSDYRSWQRAPSGLVRKDMSPKPAYNRLLSLIKGEWWTNEKKTTNAKGRLRFRGYLGNYLVTVQTPHGETMQYPLQVTKGENAQRIKITLDE